MVQKSTLPFGLTAVDPIPRFRSASFKARGGLSSYLLHLHLSVILHGMRALALGEHGPGFGADWPDPRPAAGETLVRVLRAGICETDLQLVQDTKAFAACWATSSWASPYPAAAGRRVVGEINAVAALRHLPGWEPWPLPQPACSRDSRPRRRVCRLVAIPQRNLHAVPDSISTDAAVFVEPVAAAFEIPAQLRLNRQRSDRCPRRRPPWKSVRAGSAEVSDRVPRGRQASREARDPGSARNFDLSARGSSRQPPDGHRRRLHGSASGLTLLSSSCVLAGPIVLKTTIAGTQSMEWAGVVVDEVTIVGSRCGPFDRR